MFHFRGLSNEFVNKFRIDFRWIPYKQSIELVYVLSKWVLRVVSFITIDIKLGMLRMEMKNINSDFPVKSMTNLPILSEISRNS